MQQTIGRSDTNVVGRGPELSLLDRFLSPGQPAATLVLTGGPGAGKTTLWEGGTEIARRHGLRVLSARPSDAETGLSFAAINDLFEDVDTAGLAAVPAPRRQALEIALLRAEPTRAPPDAFAISAGLLSALRSLAEDRELLIAVDDVQWLDPPSADALVFAARRLRDSPLRFLLARRPGDPSALEQALEPRGLERAQVGALSLGATQALLATRLGLRLPRRVLRQVVETGQGNPLFMLELGRLLAQRGPPEIGEEIPVPENLEELLGLRVDGLPGRSRTLLLAVALSDRLGVSELASLSDRAAVDDAAVSGILVVDGERVRPSHPLLGAAARTRARPGERRALHLELATVVEDPELRVRHLALATEGPDPALANDLAAVAADAAARGATAEAADLAEHAMRLTPPHHPESSERLLTLAGYLERAGERQRVTDLLTPELDVLPPGGQRVRAWLLLSESGAVTTYHDHARHFARALEESRGNPGLRALVLAKAALNTAAEGVERVGEAEAWAQEALSLAAGTDLDLEQLALRALGWARSLRGLQIDDACDRFREAGGTASEITDSPEVVAGLRLAWRGELNGARAIFDRFLSLADERGEAVSYAWLRLNMCELELRAGNWSAVSRLLDEWAESGDRELLITPTYQRCRALLAAGRGLPDEAEAWATPALADAEARGYHWQVLESRRALGVAALLAHEPARAVESLRKVWAYTEREGVEDPGAFPVAPDLVETLVESGELDEALAVTDRLRELAERQKHPWGLAVATQAGALVRLASAGYDEEAATALGQAATTYGELGLRVDRARSLLSLGRAQRRLKKWGAARHSLEQAVAAFDEIGSDGWAEQARAELARVGARRRRADGGLTPTEQRVAALAADGLSNKEIAATLFVTVHTIEVHLSHAYAKLGVRSRAQLARRLSATAQPPNG